jgi:transposase-like protein
VLDVLLREHRDTESAEAFFRQTLRRTGVVPTTIVSDHHQPYIRAVQAVFPEATHLRTELHRATGGTTKPIERSHIATRDRLRASRGLKTPPRASASSRGSKRCRLSIGGTSRLTGSCLPPRCRGARPMSGHGPWPPP